MLLRWSDPRVGRACSVVEVGHELWGTLGRRTVGQCLAVIDTAATLGVLFGFASFSIGLSTISSAPVLALRYRSVEILADPHMADGPVGLPKKESGMRAIGAVDRLLIHDVRCCGCGASCGVAA